MKIHTIYLSTTSDKDELEFLGQLLYPKNDFVILQVDLTLFKLAKLNFYIDPAYSEFGVFTCENIPPQCISLIEYEN